MTPTHYQINGIQQHSVKEKKNSFVFINKFEII
jgi:hypothetical protein